MSERRTLTFTSLDQVMPEVDRLLASGYDPAGKWSLGMICNHLASTYILSVEGFPAKVMSSKLFHATIGRIIKGKVLGSGSMPAGIKLPEEVLPRPSLDDRAEAEALRAAIGQYGLHQGPVADHPAFGKMTRAEWDRIHMIHSGHHLSFLVPREPANRA